MSGVYMYTYRTCVNFDVQSGIKHAALCCILSLTMRCFPAFADYSFESTNEIERSRYWTTPQGKAKGIFKKTLVQRQTKTTMITRHSTIISHQ